MRLAEIGRDALLAGAADLGGAGRDRDVRHGGERQRAVAARVDDQRTYLVDRRGARVDAPHQDVDLLLAQLVTRRDVAAHARDDAVSEFTHRDAELGGAFLVEHDLDFGVAGLDRRLDVAEGRARLHGQAYLLGGLAQAVELVARDRHLERRGEAEQRRAAELVLHACERLEPGAQRVDRGLLLVRSRARLERDGQAAGVLAGVGRAGVEPVAGAGDGVGQRDPGQRHRFLLGGGHRPVGLLERRARREPEVRDELALGQLRYQLGAEAAAPAPP